MNLHPDFIPDIAEKYRTGSMSMIDLARKFNVSRGTIYNVIKGAGVHTGKDRRFNGTCAWCREKIAPRVRSQAKGRKRVFCNSDCYHEWLNHGGKYEKNSPLSVSVVKQYFPMRPGMIIHHEDGKRTNNLLRNLKVFLNHDDHMKYHYQKANNLKITVEILWQGK